MSSFIRLVIVFACSLFFVTNVASAREVDYHGGEIKVYVVPGEPTVVSFPKDIIGGYKSKTIALGLEYRGKDLIIFPKVDLSHEGEVLIVYIRDERSFMLRVLPASTE